MTTTVRDELKVKNLSGNYKAWLTLIFLCTWAWVGSPFVNVMNLPYSWPEYDILCQKHKSFEWLCVQWLWKTRFWGETQMLLDHYNALDLTSWPIVVSKRWWILNSLLLYELSLTVTLGCVNWCRNLSGVLWSVVLCQSWYEGHTAV